MQSSYVNQNNRSLGFLSSKDDQPSVSGLSPIHQDKTQFGRKDYYAALSKSSDSGYSESSLRPVPELSTNIGNANKAFVRDIPPSDDASSKPANTSVVRDVPSQHFNTGLGNAIKRDVRNGDQTPHYNYGSVQSASHHGGPSTAMIQNTSGSKPSYPLNNNELDRSQGSPSYQTPNQRSSIYPTQTKGPPSYPTQSQGSPSYPTQSQGPPSYPTQSQGPPNYPAQSQGPPSYPTQNKGPPSYPTQNHERPSYTTKSQGPPSYPTQSQGPPNMDRKIPVVNVPYQTDVHSNEIDQKRGHYMDITNYHHTIPQSDIQPPGAGTLLKNIASTYMEPLKRDILPINNRPSQRDIPPTSGKHSQRDIPPSNDRLSQREGPSTSGKHSQRDIPPINNRPSQRNMPQTSGKPYQQDMTHQGSGPLGSEHIPIKAPRQMKRNEIPKQTSGGFVTDINKLPRHVALNQNEQDLYKQTHVIKPEQAFDVRRNNYPQPDQSHLSCIEPKMNPSDTDRPMSTRQQDLRGKLNQFGKTVKAPAEPSRSKSQEILNIASQSELSSSNSPSIPIQSQRSPHNHSMLPSSIKHQLSGKQNNASHIEQTSPKYNKGSFPVAATVAQAEVHSPVLPLSGAGAILPGTGHRQPMYTKNKPQPKYQAPTLPSSRAPQSTNSTQVLQTQSQQPKLPGPYTSGVYNKPINTGRSQSLTDLRLESTMISIEPQPYHDSSLATIKASGTKRKLLQKLKQQSERSGSFHENQYVIKAKSKLNSWRDHYSGLKRHHRSQSLSALNDIGKDDSLDDKHNSSFADSGFRSVTSYQRSTSMSALHDPSPSTSVQRAGSASTLQDSSRISTLPSPLAKTSDILPASRPLSVSALQLSISNTNLQHASSLSALNPHTQRQMSILILKEQKVKTSGKPPFAHWRTLVMSIISSVLFPFVGVPLVLMTVLVNQPKWQIDFQEASKVNFRLFWGSVATIIVSLLVWVVLIVALAISLTRK